MVEKVRIPFLHTKIVTYLTLRLRQISRLTTNKQQVYACSNLNESGIVSSSTHPIYIWNVVPQTYCAGWGMMQISCTRSIVHFAIIIIYAPFFYLINVNNSTNIDRSPDYLQWAQFQQLLLFYLLQVCSWGSEYAPRQLLFIVGRLYVFNQYHNLTVHRNPGYLQGALFYQLDKWNWDTRSCLSYTHGHITITKLRGIQDRT